MLEKADKLVELLLKQYLSGELSPEEIGQLKELTRNNEAYSKVYDELSKPGKIEALTKEYFRYTEGFKEVETRRVPSKGKLIQSKTFWGLFAAASVFLVLAMGAYLWFLDINTHERSKSETVVEKQADLTPGRNKAVLTLADGKQVILDSVANDRLTQGATTILNKSGQIIYQGASTSRGVEEEIYNTLSTARAEMYSLVLSDGSRVWLNASSSIRFPVAFKGSERKVEVSGEVYFEVAHNKSKPFKVLLTPKSEQAGMEIQVLGTSFNINSYPDEGPIKTTLLEGSVKVKTATNSSVVLKKGQQAQIPSLGEPERTIRILDNVDLQQAVAWKNGYFQFFRDDLQTVMRQVARWYDVEVVYEGEIPKREFWGKIHRNTNASELLRILEKSNVRFRIEGKKRIIVMP